MMIYGENTWEFSEGEGSFPSIQSLVVEPPHEPLEVLDDHGLSFHPSFP